MKTATARATYDFVYFFKNYKGKLNQLDAEFMNKNNYSAARCLTVHCQCDHMTTPNPKSSVLNFTRSHLVTLVMVEYFKEAHSDDPVSFTAIGIDHVPLTSRREDRQKTINPKELLDPSGLGCGVTWSECCYRQLFFF